MKFFVLLLTTLLFLNFVPNNTNAFKIKHIIPIIPTETSAETSDDPTTWKPTKTSDDYTTSWEPTESSMRPTETTWWPTTSSWWPTWTTWWPNSTTNEPTGTPPAGRRVIEIIKEEKEEKHEKIIINY
ncbi:unnamed protein product [Phyllotreta striolata]|uniref:Uncharacterized protein n=1 Tax=Phyllotreta striolata TaxID=444603 RepID=A0A9N9TPQ3_PHYSR|nr:unnamed protein product [Phyllotreta striolata]